MHTITFLPLLLHLLLQHCTFCHCALQSRRLLHLSNPLHEPIDYINQLQQDSLQPHPRAISNDAPLTMPTDNVNSSNQLVPILRLEDVTSKSIRVRVESPPSSSPVVPQKIYFKNVQRNSDWKHYSVDEKRYHDENDTFVLNNLLCGNKYQIYSVNIDREGQTSTSEVLLTKTAGREPLAPPATVFLVRQNRTSYRLNLNAWSSGGCPILGGNVQYRSIRNKHWTTLPVNSLMDPINLNDLSPDQLYKVRVTMKNSAGPSLIEYEIRSSDSKNVFQKNPSEIPNLISLGNFHSSSSEIEGPGRLSDVLIITLTLLLTTLAAVAILYKTVQKNFSSVRNHSNRINVADARASKGNFVQNNVDTNSANIFAMQPSSEFAAVSLEKRFQHQANKRSNSISDPTFESGYHTMSRIEDASHRPSHLQYLTLGRRTATGALDEYAMIQKRDGNCEIARYSIPSNRVIETRLLTCVEPVSKTQATEIVDQTNMCQTHCIHSHSYCPMQSAGEWPSPNEMCESEDKTQSALLSFRQHATSDRI